MVCRGTASSPFCFLAALGSSSDFSLILCNTESSTGFTLNLSSSSFFSLSLSSSSSLTNKPPSHSSLLFSCLCLSLRSDSDSSDEMEGKGLSGGNPCHSKLLPCHPTHLCLPCSPPAVLCCVHLSPVLHPLLPFEIFTLFYSITQKRSCLYCSIDSVSCSNLILCSVTIIIYNTLGQNA